MMSASRSYPAPIYLQGFAEQYNTDFPANRMDLVLFEDALRHLITVSRILGMPRGNMLFVGVGGSGKQSLTRLASYIAGNFTFQITITKTYNLNSFMDDMRWVVGWGATTNASRRCCFLSMLYRETRHLNTVCGVQVPACPENVSVVL